MTRAADDSASGCSESAKRRQPDSAVTLPAPLPPRKHGSVAAQPAAVGWLRGEAKRVLQAPGTGEATRRKDQAGPAEAATSPAGTPEAGGGHGSEAEDEAALGSRKRGVTEKICSVFFCLPVAGVSPIGRTVFFPTKQWRKPEFPTTKRKLPLLICTLTELLHFNFDVIFLFIPK